MVGIVISFLVGALVGITGAVVSNFFIWPIRRQLKVIGNIADSLEYHADVIFNPNTLPPEETEKVRRIFRNHATKLLSSTVTIPWYPICEVMRFVRKKEDIKKAKQSLIGLSNYVVIRDVQNILLHLELVQNAVDQIKSSLKIEL